jgi:hypothetical protein
MGLGSRDQKSTGSRIRTRNTGFLKQTAIRAFCDYLKLTANHAQHNFLFSRKNKHGKNLGTCLAVQKTDSQEPTMINMVI